MMIVMMEQSIRSKVGADLSTCEDALVVTDDFVAVIDGATSTSSRKWKFMDKKTSRVKDNGEEAENKEEETVFMTSGQWAANILVQALEDNTGVAASPTTTTTPIPAHATPREIINQLTTYMQQAYHEQGNNVWELVRDFPHERPTASLILYSRARHEIIAVGDCQAAVLLVSTEQKNDDETCCERVIVQQKKIQPQKYNDQVMSAARAMYWQIELLQKKKKIEENHNIDSSSPSSSFDPGRDFIEPLRVGQRLFQNNPKAPKPYQYWVMDGFPVEDDGIQVYDLATMFDDENDDDDDDADAIINNANLQLQIILATDGYLQLDTTLAKTEAHLRRHVMEKDPLLIHDISLLGTKGVRPGAESFDDRTYVRFAIMNHSTNGVQKKQKSVAIKPTALSSLAAAVTTASTRLKTLTASSSISSSAAMASPLLPTLAIVAVLSAVAFGLRNNHHPGR